MDKEKLEGVLIDYIDGKLEGAERGQVEQELAQNEEAFRLYAQLKQVMQMMDKAAALEPGPQVKENFEQYLKAQVQAQRKPKTVFFQPGVYRMAAGLALVMIGIGIGYWINKNQQQAKELAELRKEMEATKRVMMTMLDNQQSASQRIQGVNVALHIPRADDEVVQALVKTLNEDVNTNVRLAALEALGKFQHEPAVRKELISALSRQKDPVVQIALIQLMVKLKEKSIVNELQKIVDDTETMKAVKDEAYTGLFKLS